MKKTHGLLLILVVALVAGPLVWAVASGRFPLRQAEEQVEEPIEEKVPKVALDETKHDFGFLDAAEECAYTFLIRNEGEAPLKLERGPTTCKCTMSHLDQEPIPPGASAEVRVASKTENQEGFFSHTATIFTNDPEQSSLRLTIAGTIRTFLGSSPEKLSFAQIRKGESQTAEATLYSQVWSEFEIADVKPSREGIAWEIEPADPGTLEELQARSGYTLHVTIPPDLPDSGLFWESLAITATSDKAEKEEDAERTYEFQVTGKVPARMTMHGRNLMAYKLLDVGMVSHGTERKEIINLKVQDDHRNLRIKKITTSPDFVEVRITPYMSEKTDLGLYKIEVLVPADAPVCNFMGANAGEIEIETDHPKIPVMRLKVQFAVI